uniref:Putative secreted protein n=1 Tax=Ixodes ricinus TaxID=34613 RepID=A0A6B0UBV5_IXORI
MLKLLPLPLLLQFPWRLLLSHNLTGVLRLLNATGSPVFPRFLEVWLTLLRWKIPPNLGNLLRPFRPAGVLHAQVLAVEVCVQHGGDGGP